MPDKKLYANLDEFQQTYPHGNERDRWNHNASIYSGGGLPDPVESPEFEARGIIHQQQQQAQHNAAVQSYLKR